MRFDVIAHGRHGDDSASQAELAQRLLLQLVASKVFPSVVLVQMRVAAHVSFQSAFFFTL
jgi:hypothetical protein